MEIKLFQVFVSIYFMAKRWLYILFYQGLNITSA